LKKIVLLFQVTGIVLAQIAWLGGGQTALAKSGYGQQQIATQSHGKIGFL